MPRWDVVGGKAGLRAGFEFDGGLGLKGIGVADVEQAGGSIKEAAHAGGGMATEAAGELLAEDVLLSGGEAGAGQVDAGGDEVGEGGDGRAAGGGVTTGQGDGGQMGKTREGADGAVEEFAAPDGAIIAIAGAIEDDGDDGGVWGQAVFGGDGGGMGAMVLDGAGGEALLAGPEGGVVAGVGVVDDGGGFDVVELLEVAQGGGEAGLGFEVFLITDVGADEGAMLGGQTEGGLEIGADGEDWRGGDGEVERQGRVAAGATDGEGALAVEADDGVVARRGDFAVVEEEEIGEAGEMLEGFGVGGGDGFGMTIAGGHDKGIEGASEEEGVQGRGGQHEADIAVARGEDLGLGVAGGKENDGGGG